MNLKEQSNDLFYYIIRVLKLLAEQQIGGHFFWLTISIYLLYEVSLSSSNNGVLEYREKTFVFTVKFRKMTFFSIF